MSKNLVKKDIIENVNLKIKEFQKNKEIYFPEKYSPENAMKSAWLVLQDLKDRNGKPALEVCDKASIANALLDMVIQGLSPSKKQCYFIIYGNKLNLQRSYFGTMAVLKRLADVKEINAEVIYEGDEFEFEIRSGRKRVVKHVQKLENIDTKKIKGAYCVIITNDGKEFTEIMNMEQIKEAWKQSKINPVNQDGSLKKGTVHERFTEEMAKKTVINRAAKYFVNSSDDSDVLIGAINRTTDNEYETAEENVKDVESEVEAEIKENANKKVIDFTPSDENVIQEEKPKNEKEEITVQTEVKSEEMRIKEEVPF